MGARYRASNFVFDRVLVVAALCVLVSLVLSQRGDQRPFSRLAMWLELCFAV